MVSVFDRGFLMADAVYEVTAVLDGKLLDFHGHARRLEQSLVELDMPPTYNDEKLLEIHRELVSRNHLEEGLVYLQITRGTADRDLIYPDNAKPTIVLFTQAKPLTENLTARSGINVISVDDLRWGRRDIKTVQLLYPSMAKMAAKARGADDAWLVQDGYVTEGTSSNAYIVKDNRIITRQLSNDILSRHYAGDHPSPSTRVPDGGRGTTLLARRGEIGGRGPSVQPPRHS